MLILFGLRGFTYAFSNITPNGRSSKHFYSNSLYTGVYRWSLSIRTYGKGMIPFCIYGLLSY